MAAATGVGVGDPELEASIQASLASLGVRNGTLPQPASRWVYEGERNAQGKRHGQGKQVYTNGAVYSGWWRANRFHGTGEFSWQGPINADGTNVCAL